MFVFFLAVETIKPWSEFKNVNPHCVNIVAFKTVWINISVPVSQVCLFEMFQNAQ